MIAWLFNFVYLALVAALSPYLLWTAVTKGKYREGFSEKFLGKVPPRLAQSPQHIWLHAVSVGEVNLLSALITEVRRRHSDVTFHITTTTKAGYDLARTKYAQHTVSYARSTSLGQSTKHIVGFSLMPSCWSNWNYGPT